MTLAHRTSVGGVSRAPRAPRILAWAHTDSTLEQVVECCRDAEHPVWAVRGVSIGLGELRELADLVIIEDGDDATSEALTEWVCRTLRERALAQYTITVSGELRAARERALIGAGADYYVAPFACGRLAAYVTSLMSRALRHQESPIVIDALVVDRARRSCELRGERLALTTTEFDILLHLAQHADRLVSSEELATTVLGSSDSLSSRARLRQHVYVLRRKSPILTEMVRTIRGCGYLLQSLDRAARSGPAAWR
jgi:two-component system response regulator QseB